ncbi:MAG: amino acid adenylation domain-containing protein [Pseudomonadota bacterium]
MVTVNKKIIHTVFEEIAEKFTEKIAVRHAEREISYGDLNRLSGDIASRLSAVGVQRDVIVGILLESGIEYVAAILGVMKAGGVFLPLDMSFPEKRLEYILTKTVPEVLIADEGFDEVSRRLAGAGIRDGASPVILIDPDFRVTVRGEIGSTEKISGDSSLFTVHSSPFTVHRPPVTALPDPDDSAYIMYTSGSTGEPKAIVGCHKSLSHFVHWEVKEFGFDEHVRVTQLPPVTFDASLRDIFVPLITGGTLCIPEKEIRTDLNALLRWMEATGITLVHCVPSLFRMLLREIEDLGGGGEVLPELRYILMAGEPLYGKDVIRWMERVGERIELVNLYGPSETTLVKTFHRIRQRPAHPNAMIPAGLPISNTAILITKGKRLCEPGEIGDIFIKTPFGTKGYYRDPELTKMSFVPNPLTGDADDIVYKTGDMGRYLPDRSIEFIGRLDTQVKVNGVRIELGEIEKTLMGSDAIDQTVVVGHRSPENETTLVCYYTEKGATDAGKISAWLREALPAYMVPSFYVRLDVFPLNINGKIDRKALPKPEAMIYEGIAFQAPANETEEALARIWGEVLHLKKVGVNNPFFQTGGHSLTATRVLSRIYRELGVEVSLRDFFANQTIRALAALIGKHTRPGFTPIPVLERQPDYALSPSQRRLWILDRMEEGSVAYSLPGLFRVEGKFDIPLFHRAFFTLIARHESLRTTFFETDNGPRQRVREISDFLEDFKIGEIDLSQAQDSETLALQYAREQARVPFDLSMGPLLRVTVILLSDGRHAIFLNLHHIIGDAWSFDILARELLEIYEAYRKGAGGSYQGGADAENSLLPPRVQYRDYAAWQNARLEAAEAQDLSRYWAEKLFGSGSSPLNLPWDYPRPRFQTYRGKTLFFDLDERLTAGLTRIAQKRDASLFMVLLALVKTLLFRYSGQEDIIVGSPVACRNHPDLEDQIGFYANTLALRDQMAGDDAFPAVLEKVKKTAIDALDHQQYPFDRLVDELDLARDPGRAPLFDVMLVYRDEDGATPKQGDLRITAIEVESGTSRFDLTFEISRSAGTLRIGINYNTDLFRDATIERMASHVSTLSESILSHAGSPISELDILSPAEKRRVTETFNDTRYPFPSDKTMVDLFEAQVAKGPDRIAIVLEDREITYGNLHERAHKLARVLIEHHRIQPREMIGLMVDRNERSIVGLLGILMAGGVYLPVDPAYPRNRIDHMLADSGCRLLLTEGNHIGKNGQMPASVQTLDLETLVFPTGFMGGDLPPSHRLSPDDPAYVIYTSGSTGVPKGVVIAHSGFLNMSLHQIRVFGVADTDRVLQFASASFDAALSEVFMALFAGAAVVVVRKETIDDPLLFLQYLEEKGVTHVTLPPVYLNALDKERLKTVTTIITAGEAPNTEDAVFWSRHKRYFNAYGPTEISVCATIERVTPDGDYRRGIPIGKPIVNTSMYVLDASLHPVPIGIPGEICISGAGLAKGYHNRPELTAEKFVPHPFREGERVYRTGDSGRWLPDGRLEWLGRNDDQVKIRGYRIELGEIKNALLRHAAVKEAIVMAAGGEEELAAYFTAGERVESADLEAHLHGFLPQYMVPRYLIQLDHFPMTANGKVDRKALSDPRLFQSIPADALATPRSELEKWMLALWREVLGSPAIGIHDNFFDSGGNSLRSLQLISRILTGPAGFHFGKVPVKLLFLNPTVAGLSAAIEKQKPVGGGPPPPAIEGRGQGAGGRYQGAGDRGIRGQGFPQAMTIEREPLLPLFEAGKTGLVDAAAIISLPDGLVDRTGLKKDDLIKRYCGDHPVLSSITDTFMGRVATIVLPFFASEIFSDPAALNTRVAEALEMAGRIGADTVSLTGNLPSATDLGLDLVPSVSARKGPAITTGQATVAAAMVMTIEKMLDLSARDLDSETVGLIGLNTIGAATLFLMLACRPHPKRILLADAYNNLLFASVLRQELADCGFEGAIDIMSAFDRLPDGFYEATLLIGATNVPDIIAVDRVNPGTILITESGQPCFSQNDALRRLEKDGDILFTEGDLLRMPVAATCRMYLPDAVEVALRRTGTLSLLAFDPKAITGCVLSGLLSHCYPQLEPTIGEVDGQTCLRHYRLLRRLGFEVADPRYEDYAIPAHSIQRFKELFGVKRDQGARLGETCIREKGSGCGNTAGNPVPWTLSTASRKKGMA